MPDFSGAYEVTPPWDIGRPQPAFQALADAGRLLGRVLDAGCGTGEHALMAAALGLDATGIDAASNAIGLARTKAQSLGLNVRFEVGDVVELASLGEQWDTVLDSGCFHTMEDDERAAYVENLHQVIPAGGRFFMLCFSDLQPGEFGPRRITQEEIRRAFTDGWMVDSIEPALMETNLEERDMRSWLATITRTEH